MTNDTAQILAGCLEAIEQQGLLPEECMARHPDQRMALSELLPLAQALRSAPAVMPSLDFRIDARRRLLAQLPARRPRPTAWFAGPTMIARAALMLLMIMTLATSVVTTSAQALPNDILYPMSRRSLYRRDYPISSLRPGCHMFSGPFHSLGGSSQACIIERERVFHLRSQLSLRQMRRQW